MKHRFPARCLHRDGELVPTGGEPSGEGLPKSAALRRDDERLARKRGEGDPLTRRQSVRLGHDGDVMDLGEQMALQLLRHLGDDRNCQLRIAQPNRLDGRLGRTGQQAHRRHGGTYKAPDCGPQQVQEGALPRGEHERARRGLSTNGCDEVAGPTPHVAGETERLDPGVGQNETTPPPFIQGDVQRLPELSDLGVERGLRHVQAGGGTREVEVFGEFGESLEPVELGRHEEL